MRRDDSNSDASGWGWGSEGPTSPRPSPRPPPSSSGGVVGAVAATVAFLLLVAGGAIFVVRGGCGDGTQEEAPAPAEPVPDTSDEGAPEPPREVPVGLDKVVWTTADGSTLSDLSKRWSIPRDTLTALNPKLAADIPAGTKVVVYSAAAGASVSIGPPNDGRLVRGVPLPEGRAWLPPEDRGRAFGTSETVAAVLAALQAYAQKFPDAAPIQMGDLSARRGGKIYGHQSHQSGRDVDIRLIHAADGESFDPTRNWFLVKTLIDGGDVRAIFLNRTEQAWLRAAAVDDVGEAQAQRYFSLISHEPGHTIHMHVRYACAKQDKRCVGYSMPDTDEQDPKKGAKLPLRPSDKSPRGASKLPGGGSKRKSGTSKKKLKVNKRKKKRRK